MKHCSRGGSPTVPCGPYHRRRLRTVSEWRLNRSQTRRRLEGWWRRGSIRPAAATTDRRRDAHRDQGRRLRADVARRRRKTAGRCVVSSQDARRRPVYLSGFWANRGGDGTLSPGGRTLAFCAQFGPAMVDFMVARYPNALNIGRNQGEGSTSSSSSSMTRFSRLWPALQTRRHTGCAIAVTSASGSARSMSAPPEPPTTEPGGEGVGGEGGIRTTRRVESERTWPVFVTLESLIDRKAPRRGTKLERSVHPNLP